MLKKGTLDRHCQPTLPHLRGSWGVQEQRTNINGTTCNKNCWSDTTPGCVTQNHTSADPVARCWQTAKVSKWQKSPGSRNSASSTGSVHSTRMTKPRIWSFILFYWKPQCPNN